MWKKLKISIHHKQIFDIKTFHYPHASRKNNNNKMASMINMELPTFMLLIIFVYMFTLNNLNGITSASQTIQGKKFLLFYKQ